MGTAQLQIIDTSAFQQRSPGLIAGEETYSRLNERFSDLEQRLLELVSKPAGTKPNSIVAEGSPLGVIADALATLVYNHESYNFVLEYLKHPGHDEPARDAELQIFMAYPAMLLGIISRVIADVDNDVAKYLYCYPHITILDRYLNRYDVVEGCFLFEKIQIKAAEVDRDRASKESPPSDPLQRKEWDIRNWHLAQNLLAAEDYSRDVAYVRPMLARAKELYLAGASTDK